ncbi:MAG: hypothetical protein MJ252_22260 [archaeon]|nr:hypothetical protein [archaeon]
MKSSICLIFLLFPFIFSAYPKYKLNDHFYFDPISETACNHLNYWTPFNPNTTCYRWVNLNAKDNTSEATITIMLDHNMFQDTFDNVGTQLKVLKAKWKRYTGNITAPNQDTIYKLMNFTTKATPSKAATPAYRIGELVVNNYYVIGGTKTDLAGYWTNKAYNDTWAYSYSTTGNNAIIEKSKKRGIRPVIVIQKSLLKVIPAAIDIDSFVGNGKLIKYKWENKTYGGKYYKQLQAFSVTANNLVYSASNSGNPDYCVLYSYKGTNYSTLSAKKYHECGHANGIAFNTKTGKIEVCGPVSYGQVNQYNPSDLVFEKSYAKNNSYPGFTGIGYNADKDYYLGHSGRNIFFASTTGTWPIQYSFGMTIYETTQDIEYNDGYIFQPVADLGAPNTHQQYSLWGEGKNLVYVYNAKFDSAGKPTTDYGRLVARLLIGKKGELESVSFRNGKAYFGFATQKLDSTYAFKFYETSYADLKKKFAPSNEEEQMEDEKNIKFLEE